MNVYFGSYKCVATLSVLLSSCLATVLLQLNILSSGCIPTLNMLPVRSPYLICNRNTVLVLSLKLWMYHRSMCVSRKPSITSCLPSPPGGHFPTRCLRRGSTTSPAPLGTTAPCASRATCVWCAGSQQMSLGEVLSSLLPRCLRKLQ